MESPGGGAGTELCAQIGEDGSGEGRQNLEELVYNELSGSDSTEKGSQRVDARRNPGENDHQLLCVVYDEKVERNNRRNSEESRRKGGGRSIAGVVSAKRTSTGKGKERVGVE